LSLIHRQRGLQEHDRFRHGGRTISGDFSTLFVTIGSTQPSIWLPRQECAEASCLGSGGAISMSMLNNSQWCSA
jgi:hypothetical protein